jgi:hypothetical protein
MGIQEDIFEEFFQNLKKDKKFPDTVITELRSLWEKGEIASQEKILGAIKGGREDGSKN